MAVIFGDVGNSKRFEPTLLTEWEECVIVAGKSLPQLVSVRHFPTGLSQFSSSGRSFESPWGIVYHDHRKFQPGILAQPVCAIHAPGLV